MDPYQKPPIASISDIPVFCSDNEYSENYQTISEDHLSALEKTGHNPFMDEALWQSIEAGTVKLIERHSQGGKILDVGVGTGRLLSRLSSGYEKFGVDISSAYLGLAAKQGINVCKAFVEELPYHDNFFDTVVTTDVLEHVLDLNTAVKEILRVLKPSGILIVRVPYRESLRPYLNSNYKFVHLRNFDEDSLTLFFEKIMQVKVIEFETCGGLITREHLKEMMPNIFKAAFFLGIHGLKFVSKPLWRKMADRFYPHSEINMVVKKICG
ncbi:MAG: methyltransferase domain-containing protein [Deltaproteobacteria bacterium]|nr:methyltransferase domain-containing protein [Deltaproteobacteria bacterium]